VIIYKNLLRFGFVVLLAFMLGACEQQVEPTSPTKDINADFRSVLQGLLDPHTPETEKESLRFTLGSSDFVHRSGPQLADLSAEFMALFEKGNAFEREHAVAYLFDIDRQKYLPQMSTAANDPDASVRERVAHLLRFYDQPRVESLLVKLMADDNTTVAWRAADAVHDVAKLSEAAQRQHYIAKYSSFGGTLYIGTPPARLSYEQVINLTPPDVLNTPLPADELQTRRRMLIERVVTLDTGVYAAVFSGDIASISQQITRENYAKFKSGAGDGLLTLAAIVNQPQLVEYFLKQGAFPDELNQLQQTPLIRAALAGSQESIEVLLKFGANVNHLDQLGKNALNTAINERNMPLAKYLLGKGASINAQYSTGMGSSTSALWSAFSMREPKLIYAVLMLGATSQTYNDEGITPLQQMISDFPLHKDCCSEEYALELHYATQAIELMAKQWQPGKSLKYPLPELLDMKFSRVLAQKESPEDVRIYRAFYERIKKALQSKQEGE
jgi:hypothetical protein